MSEEHYLEDGYYVEKLEEEIDKQAEAIQWYEKENRHNQEIIIKDIKEIERLNKEVEKYKKRCYEALTLIRENYGLLDKYGIDMLDDILNGK